MKTSKLKERLRPQRPMTTINIRMPEDILNDFIRAILKRGREQIQAGEGIEHEEFWRQVETEAK